MIAECTSAPTIRRLYKKTCYSKILEGTQHIQGPHRKFMGRERKRVELGSAFIGAKDGVPRVSQVYSLLASLKHKNQNWGVGRGKQGH